jgi:hypothetical protein
MGNGSWFDDLPEDFEESVRIDRDERDHRTQAIQSYHLTADSQRFIRDFVDRMLGQADDMRTGSNYWLYGYYGSGKSHLLTVLDGLLDSGWLDNQHDSVWSDLVEGTEDDDLSQLRDHWRSIHDEYDVIPVSINLLKYQGQKQKSFSEIILSHAHQNPDLTGVNDAISERLSAQLDVAYFEKWLRTTEAWPDRQARAEAILEQVTTASRGYDWESDELWPDIQKYGTLADVVLPSLFEEVNGIRDGYEDLQPSDIDPDEVVGRLEELRSEREAEREKPVKLVLLLDEVSLFIGTDFGRLTELQTLAENIDEIESGDIQLVVTAQADIEDVQPEFAAHGADFTILKDRFPHRYQLPSKHVGDIAKRRLFEKSEDGDTAIRELLDEASVKPTESLVYSEIRQNTKPPLDSIDDDELVEFYPFLPYHAPLFLEILFNLRQEANDPAKSISSGTARAILALMHNLLQSWVEESEPDHVITLVDFYELVKPELREILSKDMHVIEGTDESEIPEGLEDDSVISDLDVGRGIADEVKNGNLTQFDLDVAKAVLLLQHVHEIIPLTEGNIAVSVMSDLNGRSWISTQNQVEESLDRLQKFIRPNEDESGARYRFATVEERIIYTKAESNEESPEWDAILQALDEHLWDRIVQDLSLPESVQYGDSGDEYPVSYTFSVDGIDFETTTDVDGGLDVSVEVQDIRPEHTPDNGDEKTLYWSIDTDGLDDLRKHLVKWWALRDAISMQNAPPAVEQDLERRANAVRSKLVSAMQSGSYTVKDRTDIRGLSKAVETAVDVGYPDDFHPVMLQVTEERLQELADLSTEDPLPKWADTIQVPSSDLSANRGSKTIQSNVMALTGRQLKGKEAGLNMNTVLDGITAEKPFYDDVRPALRAIIWGFCREGRFVPVDEDGNTLPNESVLDQSQLSTTRLKLLPSESPGQCLREGGFKETTESVADGLINLRKANQQLQSSISGLQEDVRLVADTDIKTDVVSSLLDKFADELCAKHDATTDRLEKIKAQNDICDVVEDTNTAEEWFEEVTDVWTRRLETLYQFDLQLTAGSRRFEWVDEDLQSSVTAQREALDTFGGDWWTTDGWNALVGETKTNLSTELQQSWQDYIDNQGISSFVDRIDSHPWIVPATELPSSVQAGLEREYITPLRELQRWYETMDGAIASLTSGDEDALVSAADDISEMDPLTETIEHEREVLVSRLEQLTAAVGEYSSDEVDHVGVVPDDRQSIDKRLERIVEKREADVEQTDSGVIIR